MSTSLIHNKYFAKFIPVYFLIQGNVTLGLIFAISRKRDSKYLDFPLSDHYNPYIWSLHKRYCHDHSRRFGIVELR